LALGIALPKGQIEFSSATGLDSKAIRSADRLSALEDTGLGCDSVRVWLRRKKESCDVVVETGLGRMEFYDLDPDALRQLQSGLDLTGTDIEDSVPGWNLQPMFVPCAQFVPTSAKHAFVLE
jgi:hypothetical protein